MWGGAWWPNLGIDRIIGVIGGHKVDKTATIRNQYNRIPHPALNTKREIKMAQKKKKKKTHTKKKKKNTKKNKKNSTSEKPRGQLFPNRWPQGYPK